MLDNTSPKKYSLEFSKNLSSSTTTDVPTVEIDCDFLLGAITIIGMSAEKDLLKNKIKTKKITKKIQIFVINHHFFHLF